MIPSTRTSNLILVERKTTVDGDLNPATIWTANRQVWVSITPNRGREVFKGDELASVVTHTIRGDFLELLDIGEGDRIVYNDAHEYYPVRGDSLVFDILAVMPNFDGRDDIMIAATAKTLRYGQLVPNIPQ